MLKAPMALIMAMAASVYAGSVNAEQSVHALQVGKLTIGEGQPAIIVSTSGEDEAKVLQEAEQVAQTPEADILELRVDKLAFATDAAKVTALGQAVRKVLNGKPLLLTFRTKPEGGEKAPGDARYSELYQQWLAAGFADLIDIEMRIGETAVRELIAKAHQHHVATIVSYHDFNGTPTNEAMLQRLAQQAYYGADVLKLAVMPTSPEDVNRLTSITWQMRQRSDKPLLTMAMGGQGTVTRLSGEIYGSNLTFGSMGNASAPGQIDVKVLHQTMAALHKANKDS